MALYVPNKTQRMSLVEYLKTLQFAIHEPLSEILEAIYYDGEATFHGGISNIDAFYKVVSSAGREFELLKDLYLVTSKYNIVHIEAGVILKFDIEDTAHYLNLTLPSAGDDGIIETLIESGTVLNLFNVPLGEHVKIGQYHGTTIDWNILTANISSSGLPESIVTLIEEQLGIANDDTIRYNNVMNQLYPAYYINKEGIYGGIEYLTYNINSTSVSAGEKITFTLMPGLRPIKVVGFSGVYEHNIFIEITTPLTIEINTQGTMSNDSYIPIYCASSEVLDYSRDISGNYADVRVINYDSIGSKNIVDVGINYFRPEEDANARHVYIGMLLKATHSQISNGVRTTVVDYYFVPQIANTNDLQILNIMVPVYQIGYTGPPTNETASGGNPAGLDYDILLPQYGEIKLPINPNANLVSVKYLNNIKITNPLEENPLPPYYSVDGDNHLYGYIKYGDFTMPNPDILRRDEYYNEGATQNNIHCIYTSGIESIAFIAKSQEIDNDAAIVKTPPIAPYTVKKRTVNGRPEWYVESSINFSACGLAIDSDYKIHTYNKSQNGEKLPNSGKCAEGYSYYRGTGNPYFAATGNKVSYRTKYAAHNYVIISIMYTFTNNAILNDRWLWNVPEEYYSEMFNISVPPIGDGSENTFTDIYPKFDCDITSTAKLSVENDLLKTTDTGNVYISEKIHKYPNDDIEIIFKSVQLSDATTGKYVRIAIADSTENWKGFGYDIMSIKYELSSVKNNVISYVLPNSNGTLSTIVSTDNFPVFDFYLEYSSGIITLYYIMTDNGVTGNKTTIATETIAETWEDRLVYYAAVDVNGVLDDIEYSPDKVKLRD